MVVNSGNLQVSSGKTTGGLTLDGSKCDNEKNTQNCAIALDDAEEEDNNSDVISDLTGHIGKWQLIWAIVLSFFQFPSTFHLFSFVFEVNIQTPSYFL